jgi:hypothetical protein
MFPALPFRSAITQCSSRTWMESIAKDRSSPRRRPISHAIAQYLRLESFRPKCDSGKWRGPPGRIVATWLKCRRLGSPRKRPLDSGSSSSIPRHSPKTRPPQTPVAANFPKVFRVNSITSGHYPRIPDFRLLYRK